MDDTVAAPDLDHSMCINCRRPVTLARRTDDPAGGIWVHDIGGITCLAAACMESPERIDQLLPTPDDPEGEPDS